MHRTLCIALSLVAGACMPTTAHVATAPAASAAAKCGPQDRAAAIAYVVDGKAATCEFAMALSPDRIASVEVLKGAGAPAGGVIIIQTKPAVPANRAP
jgi:hypothetical protein